MFSEQNPLETAFHCMYVCGVRSLDGLRDFFVPFSSLNTSFKPFFITKAFDSPRYSWVTVRRLFFNSKEEHSI